MRIDSRSKVKAITAILITGLAAQAGARIFGQTGSESKVLTLVELERLALERNPTLAQAAAAVEAARGRRKQAGLLPNPVIGYSGQEFAFRALTEKSEHFAFIEQTIPLGGKLKKSGRVFEQEVKQLEVEAVAQRQRVLNGVRALYWEALGAQQLIDLRAELVEVAREGVRTTAELFNVGQADRPDQLEAEIELERAELALSKARNNFKRVWQQLASAVGLASLEPARLAGDLEADLPTLDEGQLLAALLAESPEIKVAAARLERARAALARAQSERAPDHFQRGQMGYSTELLETRLGPSGRSGPEMGVEIGIRLPLLNRNQGQIAAAQAEIARAERELERLRLLLRAKLARAFRDYSDAVTAVRRYKEAIVPNAQRAYELYLTNFRQMAASYPQVLIAQRTLFQVKEDYLDALVRLRQSATLIEGFLLSGALDAPGSSMTESDARGNDR
jgi:cobalt-zinc-cadmium efflux system outer membrane protein